MGRIAVEVTKPKGKDGEKQIQVNMRLTQWQQWKLYRWSKTHKMGQSAAIRAILQDFFDNEDADGDWRSKLQ